MRKYKKPTFENDNVINFDFSMLKKMTLKSALYKNINFLNRETKAGFNNLNSKSNLFRF